MFEVEDGDKRDRSLKTRLAMRGFEFELLKKQINFVCQSYFDYSLFIYSTQDIFLCVLVYVDDFIVTINNVIALE